MPSRSNSSPRNWTALAGLAGIAALVAFAAAWRWTSLGDVLTPEAAMAWLRTWSDSPLGPLVVLLVFVAATLLMVPVTPLIPVVVLLLGTWLGWLCIVFGCLASATVAYGIGRLLWADALQRIAGSRLDGLNRALAARGVMAIATLRLVPVAPFTLVNLAAGSLGVRYRDYFWGTVLVLAPSMLGLSILADRSLASARNPDLGNILVACVVAVVVIAGTMWARRRLPGSGRDGGGGI